MKIALVNSRKPRQFHSDEPWLRATMALGYAIGRAGHTLCASVGTIGYDAALFGAAMGGGKIEAFVPPDETIKLAEYLPPGAATNLVAVRPLPLGDVDAERDRVVIHAADLVIAVAIRSGGHMEALLRARFDAGQRVQAVMPAADGPIWRGTRNLLTMGIPPVDEQLWQQAREQMESRRLTGANEFDWTSCFPTWRDAPLGTPTLAHFTRGANGAWPGQTYAEYLDDLWHGGMRARRDAPAALWRILQSSLLKASGRLIRGGFPVVSFTAASPERLDELHRYRPHLVRWDFEPWGIIFDRDWLAKREARPVKYLPGKSFARLPPAEQPFFQKHEPPKCDYSMEEEWRVLGDLDFSDAPKDAVRLVLGSCSADFQGLRGVSTSCPGSCGGSSSPAASL